MRILHVIPSLAASFGGPPKAAVEMCRELARRGHDVTIYTTAMEADGRGRRTGSFALSAAERFTIKYFRLALPGLFGISPELARTARRTIATFDIVHIHSLYRFPCTAAAIYARRRGVPYIVRPHGTLDPFIFRRHRAAKSMYEALFERRNLEAAAAVHFTTMEEMELARSCGINFRGVVVPLGVAHARGAVERQPREMNRRWPHTQGKKTILYFGRLNFKKGLDLLAQAFGAVARQRADVHLLIAGPDDEGYGRRVRQWLAAQSVLEQVTFTGMLTGAAQDSVLCGADLFVLPSYSENFGLAVVEAMAAGLPVVISDRVNIWREVQQAGAGLITNCEPSEVANAILALLDSQPLRHTAAEAGLRLVRERFTWEAAGQKMIEVYRELAETAGGLAGCEVG
jgi:glycosyltransferase involved in cell wall biosynthesis